MTKNNLSKSPKVLFFIPSFPVTSETFIEREIFKLISRQNVDVEVVALLKEGQFNYPELAEFTDYIKINPLDIILGLFRAVITNQKGLI